MPRSNKQKLAESGPIHERHLHSGIQFIVKYCGSQLIEDIRKGQLFSAATVAAAIQSLLEFNCKAKRRSQPAVLSLSTAGIALRHTGGGARSEDADAKLMEASIDRIAYCTADKRHPRVFGFVARNRVNETVELHVCKCGDGREALQLAYSLNEAFTVAAREHDASASSPSSHGNRASGEAASGAAAGGLSIDEQPAAWCDFQARSLARSDGAALSNLQHDDWVQFS